MKQTLDIRSLVPCPQCKAKGGIRKEKNVLGEIIWVLKCAECGSLSVCRDEIHWNIVMQDNTKKDTEVEKTFSPKIPVTYLCWGCGSSVTVMEDIEEKIPTKEVWDVCLECQEKQRRYK